MAQIHLSYYTGNNFYSEGEDVEQDILNYISSNGPEQYSSIFEKDDRWTVFYHMTDIRKALLSWYPFNKCGTLLEIGAGMGALTGLLCEKCSHVTAVELSALRANAIYKRYKDNQNLDIYVGNVLEMPFEEKFDYITLIGVLEYQGNYSDNKNPYISFLQKISELLKPDGKLLIAIENKYGIKYWYGAPEDHTGIPFDGINNYINGGKARTFDKVELKNMLSQAGFSKQRFYYPMPDYKMPQAIFSDSGLPETEMPHRVIPYYLYYPTLIAQEKDIYGDLLKNKVFSFFANSFLVECGGAKALFSNVKAAFITADRRPTHQMNTVILENSTVQKKALQPQGNQLITGSYANLMQLKKRGLSIVETELDNQQLTMPLIEAPLLEEVLLERLHSDDISGFFDIFDKYYNDIIKSSDEVEAEKNALIGKGTVLDLKMYEYGPILKTAFIDLIPHNCFVVNGEHTYFDQEFTKENYPAKFMLFRAMKNLYAFHSWIEIILPLERLKDRYGLGLLWNLFEDTDYELLTELTESGVSKHLCTYWYVDPNVLKENADLLKNKYNLFEQIAKFESERNNLVETVESLKSNLQISESKYQNQLHDVHQNYEYELLQVKQHLVEIISEKEKEITDCREHERLLIHKMQQLDQELKLIRDKYKASGYNLEAFKRTKALETTLLNQALRSSEQQAQYFEEKYNSIKNATCWKITKPIRRIKDIITGTPDYDKFKFNNKEITDIQIQPSKVRPCPESLLANRLALDEFVRMLSSYDVISFDVFDTLLFRQVSDPTDIFSIVGLRLGILNFKKMRIEAEREARLKTVKKNSEVNIFDIYMVLGKYLSIDIEKTMELEFQTELDYLYANPYMLSCYKQFKESKPIIFTSDMYWPKDYILRMLKHCGFETFQGGYVSCEYECGKGGGKLQAVVKTLFPGKHIIHIGDNYQSDIEGTKQAGLDTFYYQNCNKIGNPCRPDNFVSLTASLYKGIVNCHLHNGMHVYSKDYEHGFIYGGILNCGFCEWLNEYCENTQTEKILFLARDCDIISKVYNSFYKKIDNDYIVTSRFAMYQVIFEDSPEEFIQYFFKNRANLGNQTIQQSLEETGLSFLVENLTVLNIEKTAMLTNENYEIIRTFIYDNKVKIAQYFSNAKEAAIMYFSAAIGNAQKVCIADLGWGGTIFVFMRQFINKYVSPLCDIRGTYVASSSNPTTNAYVSSSILIPYLFSYSHNRDMRIITDTEEGTTCAMMMEALFTSSAATLLRYSLTEDNEITFVYGHNTSDKEQVHIMQQGIMEFARLYNQAVIRDREYFKLSPVEAFEPFNLIKYDFFYNYNVFKNAREFEFPLPRISKDETTVTLGEIMVKRGLVKL